MRRRPAVAATALLGVVLAVMAASSGAGNGSRVHSLAVRSALASVVITLGALVLLGILIFLVRSLIGRGRGGPEPAREKVPVPLILKVGALVLLGLVVLVLYFLLTAAHAHRPHRTGFGNGQPPPVLRRPSGRGVPFNGSVASLTAFAAVGLFALFFFRRRLLGILRPAAPFTSHLALAPTSPSTPSAAGEAGPSLLPDPASVSDPRQAVLAAYARFSLLMSRRGEPRRRAETVFEYERRLGLPGGTGPGAKQAATELSGLFALARYSRTGIGEEERRRAIGDLAEIERQLVAGT